MPISINGSTGISGVDGTAGTPALQGTDTNTGISFGTDEVNISTGGTNRIKVDSSGRVGVNTASPTGLFTSYKSQNGDPVLAHFYNDNAGTSAESAIYVTNSSTLSDGLFLQTLGTGTTTTGGFIQDGCVIGSGTGASGGLSIMTRANADMRFYTNGHTNERMRITSGGNVLIGCQGLPSATVEGFVASGTSSGNRTSSGSSTSAYNHWLFYNGNGVVGSISTNASATTYATSSDYRLKENVVPLTGAVDRLNLLQVHRFNFIADPDITVDGFIAHEAQAVVPECVTGAKDEVDDDGNPVYQGIDQSKLVPLLTAALQEALAEIESLKARVTALEP